MLKACGVTSWGRFVTWLAALVTLVAAAAVLLLPATASAAGFPLQAWWPLAEGKGQTVKDWSGKGNHGVLGSTPAADANDPTWIGGVRFGQALRFGGDDFATIPASASLEPQRLTVSLWFRANESPGPFKYLLAHGSDQCITASYGLHTSFNGGLSFVVWDGSVQLFSGLANPTVFDGKWHHAAGTWDGASPRLYIDGTLITGGATPTPATIDYNLPDRRTTIGAYRGGCDLPFTGDIDQVMIWSAALPVADIWAKLSSLFNPPTP